MTGSISLKFYGQSAFQSDNDGRVENSKVLLWPKVF